MSTLHKILVVGDLHFWGMNPRMRKDNYFLASLDELDEILDIAERENVEALIQVGDVFHKPEPHPIVRNSVAKRFSRATPYRKIAVIGNHDVDHNLSKINVCALGTLFAVNALEHGTTDEELRIQFHDYRESLVDELADGLLLDYDMPIQVIHGAITTSPAHGSHIVFDDLRVHPNTKLVLAGHIHCPMSVKREDGVQFINAGSITRNKFNDDHKRQPQVLLLEYNDTCSIVKPKLIELQSSQSWDKIFHVEQAQTRQMEKSHAEQYVKAISQPTLWVNTDYSLTQSLRASGLLKKIEPEVIDRAIDEVDSVRKARGIDIEEN